MSRVTTIGVGTAACEPRELEMTLTISHVDPAPDAALDAVARRDAALRALLVDLEISPSDGTTVRASLTEEHRYDSRIEAQISQGYRAASQIRVRLSAQADAGRLMRLATSKEIGAEIRGPWWRVPPDDPARLDACEAAAADARRRAEAYARAAGLRLGDLVAIVDSGGRRAADGIAMSGGAFAAAGDLEVSSGELFVGATVELTFELVEA